MRKLSFVVTVMAAYMLHMPMQTVAQTPLDRSDKRTASLISPYYFGPNAFPVPEMNDGTLFGRLRLEADAEYQPGFRGDRTIDIFFQANIPLFTDRANLSIWMNAVEWYRNSDRSIEESRLAPTVDQYPIRSGHTIGDTYVSVDILALKEGLKNPSLTIRSVLKTASDDSWHLGRYYDSPGYFFDVSIGKDFQLGTEISVRFAAQTGFLCWQTDNGRQDDAFMYGLKTSLNVKGVLLSASWCGYNGWEHNCGNQGELAHDRPMVLRSGIGYRTGNLEFDASYQYGARDFPYHRIRVGLVWYYDILQKQRL